MSSQSRLTSLPSVSVARPPRILTSTAVLILVQVLWALCFPLIARGSEMAPPLFFAAQRAIAAAAVLLGIAVILRKPMPRSRVEWILLGAVGMTATTLGFFGMFQAIEFAAPGFASILTETQPLIAAVLAYWLIGERLSRLARLGLVLGFLGIVVVALPRLVLEGGTASAIGSGYVVLGAFGVAAGNVLMKRLAGTFEPIPAMGIQLFIGSIPLLAGALLLERIPPTVWAGWHLIDVAVLGIFGTAAVYALWFWVLEHEPLSRANAFNFLAPLLGLAIGVTFFGERVGWVQIGGVALTLLAVALVSTRLTKRTRG